MNCYFLNTKSTANSSMLCIRICIPVWCVTPNNLKKATIYENSIYREWNAPIKQIKHHCFLIICFSRMNRIHVPELYLQHYTATMQSPHCVIPVIYAPQNSFKETIPLTLISSSKWSKGTVPMGATALAARSSLFLLRCEEAAREGHAW